ncbi:type VII secretion protein, YukD family [Ligilactobacillus pobuzihii]|uniref:EsaB/YukD family protein n=1 Tax=Ligilactobacillus pobuzihii TaxID=449659 RepID=UPI0019D07400|nr:EsaB/YukD family protein [Ligilactobacillus pobuzihii]MBN7274907.1 type VII secretion protein, YukD family [Ligilactobacillus pobuzihii]
MEKQAAIAIGLHFNERVIDLKVPTQVTIARLKDLLRDSLEILQLELPADFSLEVQNKPLRLVEYKKLVDYPLANGDQLVVKSGEKGKGVTR